MSLKKSLTRFVCGSMVFASLFQNFAYAENVETKNDLQPNENIDGKSDESTDKKLNEVNNLKKLSEKGFTFKSDDINTSTNIVKLDLLNGNNLNIALKEGFEFAINDKTTDFLDDKSSINNIVAENMMLKECVESTAKYAFREDIANKDKQFEILKRLTSIKKLMEIDSNFSSKNSFYVFVCAMKNAYQTLISRQIASEILASKREKVEDIMGSDSSSRGVDVSTSGTYDGVTVGLKVGAENSEGTSEKSFYKIDNSGKVGLSLGAGYKDYLSANVGYNFDLTHTLVFYSLEQFLDTYARDGKISTIYLRSPEIREISKSRKQMQKNEKKLISDMQIAIEWYLKTANVIPQNVVLEYPSVTISKKAEKHVSLRNSLDFNAIADCFASIGMSVTTSVESVDKTVSNSYLSLLNDDCSASEYGENADQILEFLKQNNSKKYLEIKSYMDSYLKRIVTEDNVKKSDVLSIFVSNLLGDIRVYNTNLSILSNDSATKEDKKIAKDSKNNFEKEWLGDSVIGSLNKGRLDVLKSAICIASYLREYAHTEEEINIFKKLYIEIERLSKLQIFSKNHSKQRAEYGTTRNELITSASGKVFVDVPVVGKTAIDVTYSKSMGDANFDDSEGINVQTRLPMVGDKLLGAYSIRQQFRKLIKKLSEKTSGGTSVALKEALMLLDKDFDNIMKDLGIDVRANITDDLATDKYITLTFFLSKVPKTSKEKLPNPLPGQTDRIIKLSDEWVLKLVKRVDHYDANVKVNLDGYAKVGINAKEGRASSKIGANTLDFIKSKFNVFSIGSAGNSDGVSPLWNKFKKGQEEQLKVLFKNISQKDKNARYEVQCLWNNILGTVNKLWKSDTTKRDKINTVNKKIFEEFISFCETYNKVDSQENFDKVSESFDKIMNIYHLYDYTPELKRAHSIKQ